MRDERYASDGRARIFGRSDIESGYLDGFWGFCGKFRPNIHSRSIGIRKSSLVRPNIHSRLACVRISTLARRSRGAFAQSASIVFSSPQSRGPIWVYSRGFDSIRPRWGVKGDCICPPPQPTRAPLLPRCWCPVPPATVLPSSAARPCPNSTRTPTCCATLPRALACCTWRATTKTRPLPLALRRRRPIPPACSIFLSTRCCADRPSSPSRSHLST